MTIRDYCDQTFTGIVSNVPRRRAVHARLFFLEIRLLPNIDDDGSDKPKKANNNTNTTKNVVMNSVGVGAVVQVLFKHGLGGLYRDGTELEALRRDIRKGDTVRVRVGQIETTRSNGSSSNNMTNSNQNNNSSTTITVFHATSAHILTVHIHGNTGTAYQREMIPSSATITKNESDENMNPRTTDNASSFVVADTPIDSNNNHIMPDNALATNNNNNSVGKEPRKDTGLNLQTQVSSVDNALNKDKEVHLPSKKERFEIFCDFLIQTFDPILRRRCRQVDGCDCDDDDDEDTNNDNCDYDSLHFYDIAGGRGELSLLLTLRGYQVTLIDPRDNAGRLSSKSRKRLRKSGREAFAVQRIFFDLANSAAIIDLRPPQDKDDDDENDDDGSNDHDSNTNTTRHIDEQQKVKKKKGRRRTLPVLIGLHPDEVTEVIVDVALQYCLPFAVVPCCVYSRLFPHRRDLFTGQPVRTHEQFCHYLQAKGVPLVVQQTTATTTTATTGTEVPSAHDHHHHHHLTAAAAAAGAARRIQRDTLEFGGHSVVLYHLGDYE